MGAILICLKVSKKFQYMHCNTMIVTDELKKVLKSFINLLIASYATKYFDRYNVLSLVCKKSKFP